MSQKEFYKYNGEITDKESKDVVAKSALNEETGFTRYYIKFYRGTMLDVNEATYKRFRGDAKYRQVNEKAFNHYVKFINGKGQTFLREAERSING